VVPDITVFSLEVAGAIKFIPVSSNLFGPTTDPIQAIKTRIKLHRIESPCLQLRLPTYSKTRFHKRSVQNAVIQIVADMQRPLLRAKNPIAAPRVVQKESFVLAKS
jgi:hypothetical protein